MKTLAAALGVFFFLLSVVLQSELQQKESVVVSCVLLSSEREKRCQRSRHIL
jgi:hypothetical protein